MIRDEAIAKLQEAKELIDDVYNRCEEADGHPDLKVVRSRLLGAIIDITEMEDETTEDTP